VARVLLEGGEVDDARLEKEVEEQKKKDEAEGRKRGVSKSRSPARRARSRSQYDEFVEPDPHQQIGYIDYGGNGSIYENTRSRRAPPNQRKQIYDIDPNAFIQPGEQMYPQGYYDPSFQQHQQYSAYPYETEMPPPLFPASRNRRGAPAALSLKDFQAMGDHGAPATPRTLAMQQYQAQMANMWAPGSQTGTGGFMSPHASAFALRSPGTAAMVSPTKDGFGGRRERGMSFDPAMLDGMHLERDAAIDPNLDDRARAQSQPWMPTSQGLSNYQLDQQPYFDGQTGLPFDQSSLNSMLQDPAGAQPFSAFGEMAAASAVPPVDRRNEISFQPEREVQYVYLRRDQAHDEALVESIRQACVSSLSFVCAHVFFQRVWHYLRRYGRGAGQWSTADGRCHGVTRFWRLSRGHFRRVLRM
jgi:hypothetical protein